MKKINLFFITLVLLMTFSCTKDEVLPETSSDIVGVWTATAVDYSGETVTEVSGQSLNTTFVGEGYDIDFTVTFNDAPKTFVSDGSYSVHLTSTVQGQTFTDDVQNLEFLQDGSWEQNGNKLILNTQGKESEGVIEKLTEDELILSVETQEDLSQQGATIISTIAAKVTFLREK